MTEARTLPAWCDDLAAAVLPLLEAVRALPAQPWRVSLIRPLAGLANALSASSPPSLDVVLHNLREATHAAAALVGQGLVPAGTLIALAGATNAALDHPDTRVRSALSPARERAPEAPLHAAHARPAPRAAPRDAYPPEPEEPPPPSLPYGSSPPPRSSVAPGRVTPDATDAPDAPDAPDGIADAYVPGTSPAAIVLAEEGGAPIPLRAVYTRIVRASTDTLACLARHRSERRVRERAREETRILELCDAVAAAGRGCVADVLAWWMDHLESRDPWKVFAPAFLLGSLDGGDALVALRDALEKLPPHASRAAQIAAEALAVAPHPELGTLAIELSRSSHPAARAVGVDLLGRAGRLDPQEIAAHLGDANAPVILAAMRGAARLPDASATISALTHWMLVPDRSLAWEAARTLARLGYTLPYLEARRAARFAETLGPRLLDVLVMFGDASDLPLAQACLAKADVTATALRALARFGHPKTWAFFVHFLADEDMMRDAADALELVFGAKVPAESRHVAAAWRDAIGAARFDPSLRLRLGEPWRPRAVITEHKRGLLSRADLDDRVDEISVRIGVRAHVDLALWLPQADATLEAFFADVGQVDRAFRPGSWECRTR